MPVTIDDVPVMTFGRYKDRPITEVPRHYLLYLAGWDQLWPETREQIMAELRRRGLGFGRFKDVALDVVPTSYLKWARENMMLFPPYVELIDEVLGA